MLLPLLQNNVLESAATVATISGTLDGATEQDVRDGGRTIIITLTNDTWVAEGATFDAQRQNIIDGLDSAQTETLGWNNEVRDTEDVEAVVRTSDTVVTITLTTAANYDITLAETITVTVPNTALVTSGDDVTGSPTLGVTPVSGAGGHLRKRRSQRYSIELDGEFFVFNTIAEVQAFLADVRETVEDTADQLVTSPVTPKPPRVRVKTGSGKPSTSVTIQREVKRTQKTINRAFVQAARNRSIEAEIAELLHQKLEAQEREDEVKLLLLL